MRWYQHSRSIKMFLALSALVIIVGSALVSTYILRDLRTQEQHKIAIWAEAMRSLSVATDSTDLTLVLKVLNDNDYIPVVVLNSRAEVTDFRNLDLRASYYADSLSQAKTTALRLMNEGRYIRIYVDSSKDEYIDVCYDQSLMLRRLSTYPFVLLIIVVLFVCVTIFALLAVKRAEQNNLWVGMSKETAHQLGTPISSLMAWTAILSETYPNDELIPEIHNDITRLQLIADRFSKIGSTPELCDIDLTPLLQDVVGYMQRRVAHSITISLTHPDAPVIARVNPLLFQWVVENLCKNAVDAMGGHDGQLTLHLTQDLNTVYLYVSDTGKGIKSHDLRHIFSPGFTTKQRGWGLGLSLAKRIIHDYHKGRIYVKDTALGRGTTFCIELRKLSRAT